MEASAPAKAILFGEHAVVYGQPAIAVPVSSLRAYASVQPSPDGLRITSTGLDIPVSIDAASVDNALALTARLVLKALDVPPPQVTVAIRSDIPIASGLGSGAAVATALARALCDVVGARLGESALNDVIYEVEKIHHGTPSGIDNTVIVYERPVYFVRGRPLETLAIGAPLNLLIADTGRSASTRAAVAGVRELHNDDPQAVETVLSEIGILVRQARGAIEGGEAARLGNLMQANHKLLQWLAVSSPELDILVQAALDAGALGAKLSGGGRGGNMIALVTSETQAAIAAALTAAGAVRVVHTEVR